MNQMETIFGSVIVACCGGIGWLAVWAKAAFEKRDAAHAAAMKESQGRHDQCETDKDLLVERIHKVEVKQAIFDACAQDPCPARTAMARASFSLARDKK